MFFGYNGFEASNIPNTICLVLASFGKASLNDIVLVSESSGERVCGEIISNKKHLVINNGVITGLVLPKNLAFVDEYPREVDDEDDEDSAVFVCVPNSAGFVKLVADIENGVLACEADEVLKKKFDVSYVYSFEHSFLREIAETHSEDYGFSFADIWLSSVWVE